MTVGTTAGGDFALARVHGDAPDPNPPGPTTPQTQITGGPSGPTNVTSPSYRFTSTLAGSTFECKLDGPGPATGTYASCASPRAYGPLTDGRYTFSVRATHSGNTDPTPETRPFTVDTVAPGAGLRPAPAALHEQPVVDASSSTRPSRTRRSRVSSSIPEIAPWDWGPCRLPKTSGRSPGWPCGTPSSTSRTRRGTSRGSRWSGSWTVDQRSADRVDPERAVPR